MFPVPARRVLNRRCSGRIRIPRIESSDFSSGPLQTTRPLRHDPLVIVEQPMMTLVGYWTRRHAAALPVAGALVLSLGPSETPCPRLATGAHAASSDPPDCRETTGRREDVTAGGIAVTPNNAYQREHG